jgi:DUF1365 family protein
MQIAPEARALSLIDARVHHARLRPHANAFRYSVPYVTVREDALTAGTGVRFLSLDRANLFSVHMTDYGSAPLHGFAFVRQVLDERQLSSADGQIVLVTMPRMLGYVFNPVSFWLCFDKAGSMRVVVAEVNNTFGERHFYVCSHPDQSPILPSDRLPAEKVFHVSPFIKVEGAYQFSFAWSDTGLGVRIDLHDDSGLLLTTSVAGRRREVTSAGLVMSLVRNPLLMFKVMALIHFQAVRLWFKGVANYRKPAPPDRLISG